MPPAVKHRLVSLVAAASLVLCIATVALWVRSYFRSESVAHINDIILGPGRVRDFVDAERHRPSWSRAAWHDEWRISSYRGTITILHNRSDTTFRTGAWQPHGWHYSSEESRTRWPRPSDGILARIGISYTRYGKEPPDEKETHGWADSWGYTHIVTIPHWLALMLASALPAFTAIRWIREHGARQGGSCTTCGYDLRATPDRCPECGAAPARPPAT
jgi:hypothetical protein